MALEEVWPYFPGGRESSPILVFRWQACQCAHQGRWAGGTLLLILEFGGSGRHNIARLERSLKTHRVCVCVCSVIQACPILCIPRTVAGLTSLSVEFSREGYWSGLLFPALGDLPASLAFPELAGRFSTSAPPGKPTLEISSGTTPSFYRTGELRLREAMWSIQSHLAKENQSQESVSVLLTLEMTFLFILGT